MPGKPIPASEADSMIEGYISYMTKLGVDMNKQTQHVSFTASTVMTFLNKKLSEGADELKVFMGLYPPGHTQAGHTTVILWPYKNGSPFSAAVRLSQGKGGDDDPDDAFNDGTSGP
jgi:hypothetical protein